MREARRATPLDAAGAAALLDVSRETTARFAAYLALLGEWQKAINLVGRSTLDDPWRRHILDCGQLYRHLPATRCSLADLGSGAGLPGLLLAIMGPVETHLVEADRRKAQFLREAARRLDLGNVTVHAARVETLELAVDVVTARALAPLERLVPLAFPLLRPGGRMLFLKGRDAEIELTKLRRHWKLKAEAVSSLAAADGSILILDEVSPLGR